MLTRDSILGRQWPVETVPAPEFGEGEVLRVKTLSAAEFLRLVELEKQHPGKQYALWFVACVCDEQGTPLFTPDDIDAVTGLPISVVNRTVDAARRLNVVTQEQAKGN